MLDINMADVMNVLDLLKGHLIAFVVVLVLAIIAMVACKGMSKGKKFLVRTEAGVAIVLALVIVANLICTGPMNEMLELVSARSYLTDETVDEATQLVTEMAEEGIVLLKNDGHSLPLTSTAKLNVFGWASTNPCYGGTGSGSLNDQYPTVTLLQGLEDAGFELNSDLSNFYTSYEAKRPEVGMMRQDWTLPEPNVSAYSNDLINNAKAFSDAAVVVITRVGGEGADLPTDMTAVTYDDSKNEGNDWDSGDTYLSLTNREEELLDLVTENFETVVVVYNGANAIELGTIQDNDKIDGVIWCAGTGQSGFTALGEILAGTVNPSGKTVDTFVRDLTAAPYFNNIGNFVYDNMDEFQAESFGSVNKPTFVNYVESIYVGYKFYETAAAEGLIDYDEQVVYPFGYGLSYTSFEQKMGTISESNGTISLDVTVTNTGSAAGKDVVEVYYNPPYTNGGIEKASTNLVAFGKTDLLEPGNSQTLTLTFSVEDMASYDAHGAGCYVLEKGDYIISINSDSHNVIDSQTYTVSSTVTYGEGNARSTDLIAATNLFGYAEGEVNYLSRKDSFANYAAATAAPVSHSMSAEAKAGFINNSNYLTAEATAVDENPNAGAVTTGANNNVVLKDLRGLDYDDPKWDDLLDEMTLDEYNSLISLAGFQTTAVKSIDKIRTNDNDGPASINNNFTGIGSVGFPSATMIAATWNTDLVLAFGESIGQMGDEMNTTGWYGPAMNIHRSAFAGRNFEYYSEDGFLSGKMAANAITGAQNHGLYAFMKHFALNDQETNRNNMICTWSNEQAIREIYLKPFELAVKEGHSHAVMSSFNYIGNRWAGGTSELCQTVLRDEWGFQGFVETDYFGVYGYMSADQAIRNGSDAMLVNYGTATNDVQFRITNGAQQAMRTAAHNILYTVVNSRAYTEENYAAATGMPLWEKALIGADVAVAVVLILCEVMILKSYKKKEKQAT